MMKLSDLSDINRRILVVMKDIHCGGRRHIADLAGLQPNQVSPALNRLEVMGFIDRPTEPGAGWIISDAGYALFGMQPPVVEAEPEQEPDHEPEPAPDPMPVAGPYEPGKSAEIMTAMEIELALEQVRGRLTAPLIPARAARVYLGILSALPQVLIDELAQITAIVDVHG